MAAENRTPDYWPQVNLRFSVSEGVPIQATLVRDSEEMASMIYSRMHVRLNWSRAPEKVRHHQTCPVVQFIPEIEMQLDRTAPPTVSDSALAMAAPYARAGVRIVIFYSRVVPLLSGHSAPEAAVLGYVFAHEIGHVLQGTARHSDVGVMRARWTSTDFVQMGHGLLAFTRQDEEMIRVRLNTEPCDDSPKILGPVSAATSPTIPRRNAVPTPMFQ